MVTLEAVIQTLLPHVSPHRTIYLYGGIVRRGESENDIDLSVKGSPLPLVEIEGVKLDIFKGEPDRELGGSVYVLSSRGVYYMPETGAIWIVDHYGSWTQFAVQATEVQRQVFTRRLEQAGIDVGPHAEREELLVVNVDRKHYDFVIDLAEALRIKFRWV